MPQLPPGCRDVLGRGTRLIVRETWAGSLAALGLPDSLAHLLQAPSAEAASAVGRAPVQVVKLPDRPEEIVLRRCLHGGLLGPILGKAYLGLGRALEELRVTTELRRSGAPVPEAVGIMGEQIVGPLWAPVVATIYLRGAVDGLGFLDQEMAPPQRLEVIRAAGRAVRTFHDAGGRHADLHIKNLLVRRIGEAPEVFVIDLDRTRVTPGLTPGERMAQIMRLFRSLVKRERLPEIGARGMASFFGAYCGEDRALRRAMRSRVDREMRKVAVHALGYRAASSNRS